MRVCIIGGGNIGAAIAAMITASKGNLAEIVLHTSQAESLDKSFYGLNGDSGLRIGVTLRKITNSYHEAVDNADVIFITHPSFMVRKTVGEILPYLKKGAAVGVVPGSGGAEFFSAQLTEKGHIFFGADRVPCISRRQPDGNVTYFPKASIRIGTIPCGEAAKACMVIGDLLGIQCLPLACYLTVALTPSNPILHTARLYAIFKDYQKGKVYPHKIFFYREWDLLSSEILLACDAELQHICKALNSLPLEVIPLSIHYESDTPERLTKKIRSIRSLENIESPMIEEGKGFIPDLKSRYFTEDFPYGLCILKDFARICGIDVPYMDMILRWYEKLSGVSYFQGTEFFGRDLRKDALPQGYGLATVQSIIDFYKR